MGLGNIPWHESVRWAEREGLDDDETETLIDIIEKLDGEEHRLEAAKREKDDERSKTGAGG